MMRKLASLQRDERGAAIIELAIIAPVLALLTVGVVDMANGFGRKMKLEQAAQRAIEKVMNTTGETTVEATIIQEAATQAEVTIDKVQVTYRLECNGSVSTATECQPNETESKWISVSVEDKYTPLFPLHFKGINSDGTYHIRSEAGVRVE